MKQRSFFPLTFLFILIFALSAFAGEWKQDSRGYWWDNGDGTFPKDEWVWIDGDGDGVAECYYFDKSGYLLTDTVTPDGSEVNEDGAWILGGEVMISYVNGTPETSGPLAAPAALSFQKTIAGRLTLTWASQNNTEKEIKKLRLHIRCFDEAGAPAVNSCNGSDEIKVTVKDVIAPGAEISFCDVIGYSGKTASLTVDTVDVWYADGEKETVEYGFSTRE